MVELSFLTMLQAVGVVLGLWGQFLIAKKKRSAFIVWAVSNVVIVALNLMSGLYLMAGLFAVYFAFCIYSFWNWGRMDAKVQPGV